MILLLLLTLATLVVAKDKQELLIDSSRNAVLKVTTEAKTEDVTGTASMQADFAKGLAALKGDLKFGPETQKSIKDGQGALYISAGAALMELVGDLDIAIEPTGDMPKKLVATMEAIFTEKKSYANGKLDIEAPSADEVPKVTVDGTMDASAQMFSGQVNFGVDLKDNVKEVPFKTFSLTFNEKDTATNISLNVAMDAKHPEAEHLRQMGKNPDVIKQGITSQLGQMKITLDKIEMAPFEDKPEGVSGGFSIVIKDWRGTVKQQLDAATASAGKDPESDAKKMAEAAQKMIDTKIDNFEIKLGVDGNNLKGDVAWGFSNAQSFLTGYADLALLIINQAQKDSASEDNKGKDFAMALNRVQAEELQKAVKAMIESGVKLNLKGNLTVEGTAAGGATPAADQGGGDVKVTGNFDLGMDNYAAYVEKAIAAGLPMGKNQAVLLDLKLAENKHLQGKAYIYTDGKIAEYYKGMLMNIVGKMKGMDQVGDLLKSVEFKSASMAFNLTKDGVTFAGFGESSDLVPVFKTALEKSGAPVSGNPLGMSVDLKASAEESLADINIYMSDFMKGKSDADLKKIIGGDATINSKAKPEEVQLVAVSKPEVKVPEALVAFQKEGQAKLSSPAVAGGTGGSSAAGGGGSLPIIGGVAVLVLLGVGVMAGRGKK